MSGVSWFSNITSRVSVYRVYGVAARSKVLARFTGSNTPQKQKNKKNICKKGNNNIANCMGLPRDEIHKHYQGVLYCQNDVVSL
jgi:hypothetical protein